MSCLYLTTANFCGYNICMCQSSLLQTKRPWGARVATQFLPPNSGKSLVKLSVLLSALVSLHCCCPELALLFACKFPSSLSNVCLSSDQVPRLLNPLSVSFPQELPNRTQPRSSNMCFKCDPDLRNVWGEIRSRHHPCPANTPPTCASRPISLSLRGTYITEEAQEQYLVSVCKWGAAALQI